MMNCLWWYADPPGECRIRAAWIALMIVQVAGDLILFFMTDEDGMIDEADWHGCIHFTKHACTQHTH